MTDTATTHACTDCGIDTSSRRGCGEMYMVHHDLWITATHARPARMLCVGCIEDRIGRRLNHLDFIDCPLNTETGLFPKSDRLLERMAKS